jgi:hypothetical protein
MDSNMTVEMAGAASAQLIRPDVANAQWMAFPLAAWAWRIEERASVQAHVQHGPVSGEADDDAIVFVEQLPEFDAWRVGGGVAFRW